MYTDAYPSAVPLDRLEQLANAAAPCWTCNDVQQAWTCALGAASDHFCSCLTLAAGGIGGERERAILDAIAGEMHDRAERQLRHVSAQPLPQQWAPVAAGLGSPARSDRTCPRCGVALPSVPVRGRLLASCALIALADALSPHTGSP